MPSHVVSLRRISGPSWCCGAEKKPRTEEAGTVVAVAHSRRCRVGRVLRQPGQVHRPGAEIAEVDDRRQLWRSLA